MKIDHNYVIFREVQKPRHGPLVTVAVILCWLVFVAAGLFVILGMAMAEEVNWKQGPAPPEPSLVIMAWALGVFMIALSTGSLAYTMLGRLITEVRTDGVYCRYYPAQLKPRRVPQEGLQEVSTVPLGKIGGPKYTDDMYYASGSEGVRLNYENGSQVVVGTQKPIELERAIR